MALGTRARHTVWPSRAGRRDVGARPRRAIVFLDVDGTFAHHGVVPDAHVRAVRDARGRGHRVLLCTGRPLAMLTPHILATGFDGVVASGGAHVTVAGRVLRDRRFPPALARRSLEVLDGAGARFVLESPERVVTASRIDDEVRYVYPSVEERADQWAVAFSKINVLDAPVPVRVLGAAIGRRVAVLPTSIPHYGDRGGEVFLRGVHKASGAAVAARAMGGGPWCSVAIGDGPNDLELLSWARVGVAVAGAPPAVMAVADRVTGGPRASGVAATFGELGLV